MTDTSKIRALLDRALDPGASPSERLTCWGLLHDMLLARKIRGPELLELLGVPPAIDFLRTPAPPDECVHGARMPWGRYVGETYTEIAKKDLHYLRWAIDKLPEVHKEAAEEAMFARVRGEDAQPSQKQENQP